MYFKEKLRIHNVCQIFDFTGKPFSGQLVKPTETVIHKFVYAMSTRAKEYTETVTKMCRLN